MAIRLNVPIFGQRRQVNRPQLRTLEPVVGERHASWLELFFDLVFVFAVGQIAHILADHSDLVGFLTYLALFVPVWYSWIGYTFYADRFETEETSFRVLMFAGMLAVLGLSLTLGGAFTPAGDGAFVACLVLVWVVLGVLYARAAYYVPLARPYCLQFVVGIGISSMLMLASLLIESPARYGIWAMAQLVQFAMPFFNLRATRLVPIDRSHIPERFGLFTIIVLGEVVIATATGASSVAWNFATVAVASLGFGMAACIWWINFNLVEDDAVRSSNVAKRFAYLYGHFFIVASIVAAGIGAEHAIKEAGDAHLHTPTLALIGGGLAVYLGVVTFLRFITGICNLVWVRLVIIAISLAMIWLGQLLPPLAVVALLFVVTIMGIWIEGRFDSAEESIEEEPHVPPCPHAAEAVVFEPRNGELACEECVKNNYKWVHLRLCMSCGHVGCCDTSKYTHASKHFQETGHPIVASLEPLENWAWCYEDDRFVPAGAPAPGSRRSG
jgi:low temperature requirement protein LtrA